MARSDLPAQLFSDVARLLGARLCPSAKDAPTNSLMITGCIQKAEAGNAVKRLVGMGMGASELSVHVQVYRGDQIVREFDADVTAANKLPPIGPVGFVVHGVRGLHETLGADVPTLSKQIAKQAIAE